jgi:hypothetical protein
MWEVVFEEQGVEMTQVFVWFLKFRSSVIFVEGAEQLGCPLLSSVCVMRERERASEKETGCL